MKYFLGFLMLVCAMSTGRLQAADELEPGWVGEYYNIGEDLTDFPNFDGGMKPETKKIDKEINFESTDDEFAGTKLIHQFAVRWTGVIKIPKNGKYKFFTESDDGSRLMIDGKQVVDNNGAHGMEEKESESLELTAGEHKIQVDYFEVEGGHGCKASWQPDGGTKEIIPAAVVFHKKG